MCVFNIDGWIIHFQVLICCSCVISFSGTLLACLNVQDKNSCVLFLNINILLMFSTGVYFILNFTVRDTICSWLLNLQRKFLHRLMKVNVLLVRWSSYPDVERAGSQKIKIWLTSKLLSKASVYTQTCMSLSKIMLAKFVSLHHHK